MSSHTSTTPVQAISEETAERPASEAEQPPLWAFLLVRGVVMALFGAASLTFPLSTLMALAIAVGALITADGVVALWRGARGMPRSTPGASDWLLRGVACVLLGSLMLLMPLLATIAYSTVALVMISTVAVFLGAIDVALGFARPGERLMISWGVLLLGAGLAVPAFLIIWPASFISVAWIIGIYSLFAGLTMISRSLVIRAGLRRVAKDGCAAAGHSRQRREPTVVPSAASSTQNSSRREAFR